MFQPKKEDWHKQPYIAQHEKITVEEIENIFFGNLKKYPIINQPKEMPPFHSWGGPTTPDDKKDWYLGYGHFFLHHEGWNDFVEREAYEQRKLREEKYIKRLQTKGIAKCLFKKKATEDYGLDNRIPHEFYKKCKAKAIRAVLLRSEKNKKRKPGDIFFILMPIVESIPSGKSGTKLDYFTYNPDDKPLPGMVCSNPVYVDADKVEQGYKDYANPVCVVFDKSTLEKLEKFKRDPSNEKILGKKLIKYIKGQRLRRSIHAKIGSNDYYWPLIGDMLNDIVVGDVKKNNISLDLQKRRALLKKYSLILKGIKKKLAEDKYKSIDKDVSKLSKTYENLQALTTNETVINIDEAVDNIFDTNKLIQKSVLNSKDNEEEKLLALSSIYFMQTLIDSILSTIPEKYYVERKELNRDLFSDKELEELDSIIDTMIKKNKEIKSAELAKSKDIINKYINTSDVIKKLDDLGMKNSINKEFTQNTASKIVNQELTENLNKDMIKDLGKLLKEIDNKELSDVTKEASNVVKEVSDITAEVSSEPAVKHGVLDKKFGAVTLRQLIAVCRSRGNC